MSGDIDARCDECPYHLPRWMSTCSLCPKKITEKIVREVTEGFRADVQRIMAEQPDTKPGDMTTEQQCQMVLEASGWRSRALKAEAELAAIKQDASHG